MDIKLGRSSLTKNGVKKGAEFIASRKAKDEATISASLGFVVCGYVIYNKQGEKTDSGYKTHKQVTEDKVCDTLKKIMCDDEGKLIPEVKQAVLDKLNAFRVVFEDVKLVLRGASAFITVDKAEKIVGVHLIDLNSIELVDAPDQDLVYGISTLAKYVEKC
jgi:hypothetical protein